MGDTVKRLREEMIEVYGMNCWMDKLWIPSKRNVITYHHLIEKRNGGKSTLENGALLSHREHEYLNYLDNLHHEIYKELNGIFYELNRTYSPPTDEYYEEVKRILKRR